MVKVDKDYWKDEVDHDDQTLDNQGTQMSQGNVSRIKRSPSPVIQGASPQRREVGKYFKWNTNKPLGIPQDFKSILQDFTIAFMIDQPKDVISYGVQYFQNLKLKRTTVIDRDHHQSEGRELEALSSKAPTPPKAASGKITSDIVSQSLRSIRSNRAGSQKPLEILRSVGSTESNARMKSQLEAVVVSTTRLM